MVEILVVRCMKSKKLERYKIIKILGQSTFSDTFLAKDNNWYGSQRYVIKRFRPILGHPQAEEIAQVFAREASALHLLSGKNQQIPQVYEYFMDGSDFYLVREWIEGITLEQKVQQQGKLSQTQVKEILTSILSLLKYIHVYDIVYPQLKPSSIIMSPRGCYTKFDRQDIPVLIYFDRVTKLEKKVDRHSLVLAGRHQYTSSEPQESIAARYLYTLGLTAVYLLTGKTPAQLNTDPHTQRLLWRTEASNVTSNFARVIDRAISRRKSDRFSNPDDMLRGLNYQSVTVSPLLISAPDKKLQPEIKIATFLFTLGLGVLGIAWAILNVDFVWPLDDNTSSTKIVSPSITSQSDKPTPTPEDTTISKQIQSHSGTTSKIPVLGINSSQKQIINFLGKPTKISKGYWGNSQAFLYKDFIPKVDLGYLIDINSKTIRQTEISFADSIDLTNVHRAVELLLSDNYSPEIKQKIDLVFSQQSKEQRFEAGNLEGIIQRNYPDRVYIAIWERNFH